METRLRKGQENGILVITLNGAQNLAGWGEHDPISMCVCQGPISQRHRQQISVGRNHILVAYRSFATKTEPFQLSMYFLDRAGDWLQHMQIWQNLILLLAGIQKYSALLSVFWIPANSSIKCCHICICCSRYPALSTKYRLSWNGWVFVENERYATKIWFLPTEISILCFCEIGPWPRTPTTGMIGIH